MWNIVRSSVIVAVVLLAGCAEQQQQPAPSAGYGYSSYYRQVYPANPFFRPYQPAQAYPQLPPGAAQPSTSSFSLIPQAEAAPAPAPYVPPPRIAPAPPIASPEPSTPADTSCGWWDPCHLWQH
jgi:hypothetical protein